MTRLTNTIRGEVATKIIKTTFAERFTKLESEEAKMAVKIRNAWLGQHKRAYLKLPAELQVARSSMQINLARGANTYDRFDFGFAPKIIFQVYGTQPGDVRVSKRSTGRAPVGGDRWTMLNRDEFDSDTWADVIAHVEKYETLESDVKKLFNKVMEQLRGCTTVKRLNELWPEAVSYVPAQDNPIALVVDRQGVNELISCMKEGDCG